MDLLSRMTKQQAALLSVLSNSLLVTLKLGAGLLMGSISVLSEAVHSGIDLLASIVATVSIAKAVKPADGDHPYGHGKFENISGFFEAILVFVAAAVIIAEAAKKLFSPVEVAGLDWGILVMLASVALNVLVSSCLFKIARRDGSIALEADALHLSVDVWTSAGVLAGLVLIRLTGWTLLDPIIALVVAAMIIKAAWDLTQRTLGDLADKALPEEEVAEIEALISRHPQVHAFHRLRSRKCGARREIDLHIKIEPSTHVDDAHRLCHEIEAGIKAAMPGASILIHVEPWENRPSGEDSRKD